MGELGPRPVTPPSMVDAVIGEVRRAILDGSLRPGARVAISDLSERMHVSHIPVREALRQLEGEGLLEMRRGRGAVVAPVSLEDLDEILRLREIVEGDLLARAGKEYSDEDMVAIEAAWEALEIRPDDDAERLLTRHADFHRSLVAPAARRWSLHVWDMLARAGNRYLYLIVDGILTGPADAFREHHRELYEAALARDPRMARRAMRTHMTNHETPMMADLLAVAARL